MGYIMRDLLCGSCLTSFEALVNSKQVEGLVDDPCPNCGSSNARIHVSAPAIRTSDSVSFRDGYRRKGFQDMKEAAALEIKKANSMNPKEKYLIQQEIDKVRATKT